MTRTYKWLKLRKGARWPAGDAGRDLCRRLNNTARVLQQPIMITSGQRTNREQWAAYMDYLRGGILAAPCCSKHYVHGWTACGRHCMSNHCQGRAADCIVRKPSGEWVDIGRWDKARNAMRHHHLCLPVGYGEVWHVEVGTTWNS